MADEVRLIDANDYRKRRCRTCINRVQCDNGGNLCFDIMVLNTCPTIEAQPDNGWISVKERLPDECEEVLIYCPEFLEKIRKALCTEGDFYIEKEDLIVEPNPNGCTHWMPLPKPPKGEE